MLIRRRRQDARRPASDSLCSMTSSGTSQIPLILLVVALLHGSPHADAVSTLSGQPHIIFIVADDMGWNDVSFHGSSQIPTPNIDALCYNGIILNSYYSQPVCTPSRAALMTGKYPIRMGMQGNPLSNVEKRGLPLSERLLPEHLRDLGYTTRAVGKWHLGMARTAQLPTSRGFDSHFGYRGGFTGYYNFMLQQHTPEGDVFGFDLYRNRTPAWSAAAKGTYATDLYTQEAVDVIGRHNPRSPLFLYLSHLAVHAGNEGEPLQALPQDMVKMRHIVDANRRTYAAMVSRLDLSVGLVLQALERRGMLESSLVVFISDNGAPSVGIYKNWGSNWPFRGIKDTLWEGGMRVPACVWGRAVRSAPRVSTDLMHISDWLPTLVSAAGGFPSLLPVDTDGRDQWSALLYGRRETRAELLHNIDERKRVAAIRRGAWKLVLGKAPAENAFDLYYGEDGTDNLRLQQYDVARVAGSPAALAIRSVSRVTSQSEMLLLRSQATVNCVWQNVSSCDPRPGRSCLFDIEADPCEQRDLASLYPHVVKQLKRALAGYRNSLQLQPSSAGQADPRAYPRLHNHTYTPWLDYEPCGVDC